MLWFWIFGLLAAAVVLALLECVVPSGGMLAVLTLCALVASVGCAIATNSLWGFAYVAVIVVGTPLVLRWLINWFPHSPMGRRLLLQPENDPALKPDAAVLRLRGLIGRRGVAVSRMMPCGLIEVAGERCDAVSDSGPIDPGTEIIVVRLDGMTPIIRRLPTQHEAKIANNNAPTIPIIEDPFA